jgi:glutamate N-acetyltransferase / amino-acid N-acetyltransferase
LNLPLGYRYAATYAGIRKDKRDDLALIVSGIPASAAAVFTQNVVAAAPVRLSRKNLKQSKGTVGAILINAGNANCATRTGDKVSASTASAAAKLLRLKPYEVLLASTGVIGVELDPKLITDALPRLAGALSADAFPTVARAILTTDLVAKEESVELTLRRGTISIAGMTKGSGMIQPRMATTLGFVVTDAAIAPAVLQRMLARANSFSYDRISVDGDTSTNDSLVLLANGATGFKPDAKELPAIEEAITHVCQSLAKQIARDGEGAKKLITIDVTGTARDRDAAVIARSIANSPLVKTAIAGSDPNWGRIICAAGNAGIPFDPTKVSIDFQGVSVCRNGLAVDFSEPELKAKLDTPDCHIRFQIRSAGKGHSTFWTCDLTEGYIRINGSYRT